MLIYCFCYLLSMRCALTTIPRHHERGQEQKVKEGIVPVFKMLACLICQNLELFCGHTSICCSSELLPYMHLGMYMHFLNILCQSLVTGSSQQNQFLPNLFCDSLMEHQTFPVKKHFHISEIFCCWDREYKLPPSFFSPTHLISF